MPKNAACIENVYLTFSYHSQKHNCLSLLTVHVVNDKICKSRHFLHFNVKKTFKHNPRAIPYTDTIESWHNKMQKKNTKSYQKSFTNQKENPFSLFSKHVNTYWYMVFNSVLIKWSIVVSNAFKKRTFFVWTFNSKFLRSVVRSQCQRKSVPHNLKAKQQIKHRFSLFFIFLFATNLKKHKNKRFSRNITKRVR